MDTSLIHPAVSKGVCVITPPFIFGNASARTRRTSRAAAATGTCRRQLRSFKITKLIHQQPVDFLAHGLGFGGDFLEQLQQVGGILDFRVFTKLD